MQQYELVIADIGDKRAFIDRVNALLSQGWSLQGGIAVVTVNHSPVLAQALYKDK